MNLYAPPDIVEFALASSITAAIINAIYLVIVILWWARSDYRLLHKHSPEAALLSKEDRQRVLTGLRGSIMYFDKLPLLVDRSPLRLLMDKKLAPSLAPILITLALQSIPFISHFAVMWYSIHAGWHIYKWAEKFLKQNTPGAVKRLLFTSWF